MQIYQRKYETKNVYIFLLLKGDLFLNFKRIYKFLKYKSVNVQTVEENNYITD